MRVHKTHPLWRACLAARTCRRAGHEECKRNRFNQKTAQLCTCGMMEVSLKKTGFDEVLKGICTRRQAGDTPGCQIAVFLTEK